VVRWLEGIPEAGALPTEGLITWNPKTKSAEFLASQGTDSLLFRGYYEAVSPTTVRRVYDVIHPDGRVQPWRETFELKEPDLIDWTTEISKDGKFIPWGSPDFRAVRVETAANRIAGKGTLETENPLALLQPFIGTWVADPAQFPEKLVQKDREAGIEGRRTRLQWGNEKKWIRYEEQEQRGGVWATEGSAVIGWDPVRRALLYTEYAISGNALHGVFEALPDGEVRRLYIVSYPSGEVVRWRDDWRAEDGGQSFRMTTEIYREGGWKTFMPSFVLGRVE